MKKLSIREARKALSNLDEILETEGEVTITKRGKAVARVIQYDRKISIPSHRKLRGKMVRLKKSSAKSIREDRDAR